MIEQATIDNLIIRLTRLHCGSGDIHLRDSFVGHLRTVSIGSCCGHIRPDIERRAQMLIDNSRDLLRRYE